jgi:hypothetical protein
MRVVLSCAGASSNVANSRSSFGLLGVEASRKSRSHDAAVFLTRDGGREDSVDSQVRAIDQRRERRPNSRYVRSADAAIQTRAVINSSTAVLRSREEDPRKVRGTDRVEAVGTAYRRPNLPSPLSAASLTCRAATKDFRRRESMECFSDRRRCRLKERSGLWSKRSLRGWC